VSPPAAEYRQRRTITFTPAPLVGPGTSTARSHYCNGLSSSAASGGKAVRGQCLDHDPAPALPAVHRRGRLLHRPRRRRHESNSNNVIFKGNWLNFFPPSTSSRARPLTTSSPRQSTPPHRSRVGVVSYDTQNLSSTTFPAQEQVSAAAVHDGGTFISSEWSPTAAWSPDSSATATQQTSLITAVRAISFGNTGAPIATPLRRRCSTSASSIRAMTRSGKTRSPPAPATSG